MGFKCINNWKPCHSAQLRTIPPNGIPVGNPTKKQRLKFCPFLGPNHKILPQGKSSKQELIPESNEINIHETT